MSNSNLSEFWRNKFRWARFFLQADHQSLAALFRLVESIPARGFPRTQAQGVFIMLKSESCQDPSGSSVKDLRLIQHQQQPVLTTELLSHLYETEPTNIRKNFNTNKDRFQEGKHFFKLEGEELQQFKNCITESNAVQINKHTPNLILWTERGAARHAKMLDTDKAWEVFERLEEGYFNQEKTKLPQSLPDALRQLACEIEVKEKLQIENSQLSIQNNHLSDTVQNIASTEGLQDLNTIAQSFSVRPKEMRNWMRKNGILKDNNLHYQRDINKGCFRVVQITNNGRLFPTTMVTPKGVLWLEEMYFKQRHELWRSL